MVHLIRLAADSRPDAVRAALARTDAQEVALVIPLGADCALADGDALAALYDECETLGKAVVIIGGDARLRAGAVAAGFAAATSLEEWETGEHRAVSAPAGPTDEQAPSGYLYVLLPEADDAEPGLYDSTGDDPPAYVADLLPPDPTPPAERYAAIPTQPRVRTPAQERRDEARREAAQAAAQERARLAYEERVTSAIRATGTLADNDAPGDGEQDSAADTTAPPDAEAGQDGAEAEGN
ncbi:MAG TPA: hypothetical protein VIG30_16295 [Ktedonobacterales bacterium]